MELRLLRTVAELEAIKPAWLELLACSRANEPTLSPHWLLPWWKQFGAREGRQLLVGVFEDAGNLVGMAPMVRRTSWHRGCIPLRVLEFLASGEPARDAICSDYLNLLSRPGYETPVADAFADSLASGEFGAWDTVSLCMMDAETGSAERLRVGFARHGLQATVQETTRAPFIALPHSWEEYTKQLSKKNRQMIKYTLRDFDRWAGSDQCVREAKTVEDLERGSLILMSLHKLRWEKAESGGVFRSPFFLGFHHEAMRALLEAGALQLLWLVARGQPVAAMYNLVWNNKVYFYQSGRNPELPSQIRPGAVIIAKAIQKAIEEGRREFDFLGGVSTYKMQLATATRSIVRLHVYRPGLRSYACHTVESLASRLRQFRIRRQQPATDHISNPEKKVLSSLTRESVLTE